MSGWLPNDWGDERAATRADQAVAYVKRRARRERNIRLSTLAAAACFAGALGLWVVHVQPPSPTADVAARLGTGPAQAPPSSLAANHETAISPPGLESKSGPASRPASPSVDVTLQKAGGSIELAWQGDPGSQYVVYRCTSPRFDVCGIGSVVKGTTWTDGESGRASVVYYKVEPKGSS